jgi:hypothetical protein
MVVRQELEAVEVFFSAQVLLLIYQPYLLLLVAVVELLIPLAAQQTLTAH